MSATETSRGDDEALPAEVGSDESSPPVNPWRSPRQDPVCGVVQPRIIPPVGKPTRHTNQLEHTLEIVKTLMKKREAWPFLKPVDTKKLNIPDYHDVIKRPMDLTTIEKRLKNVYYWSAKECMEDMMTLFNNCYTYNPPTFEVVKMAQVLEKSMLSQLAKLPPEEVEIARPSRGRKKNTIGGPMMRKTTPKFPTIDEEGVDPGPEHHRVLDHFHNAIVKTTETEREPSSDRGGVDGSSLEIVDTASFPSPSPAPPAVQPSTSEEVVEIKPQEIKPPMKRKTPSVDREPAGKMTTRRESGRPIKKPLHLQDYNPKQRNRHKLSEQLKYSQKLVNELFAKKNKVFTWPFLEPVDTVSLQLHDYLAVVKRPMDLGTIKHKLEDRAYENAAEVFRDLEQVWVNCCAYNPAGDPIHDHGITLKKFVTSRWKQLPPPDEEEGGLDDDSRIDDLVLNVSQELNRYNNYCEVLTKYYKDILDMKMRRRESSAKGRKAEDVSEALQKMKETLTAITLNKPLDGGAPTREASMAKSISPAARVPAAAAAARAPTPVVAPQRTRPRTATPEGADSDKSLPKSPPAKKKPSPPAKAAKVAKPVSSDSEESSTESDDEPPVKQAKPVTPPVLVPEAAPAAPPPNRRGRKPGSKNKPKIPPAPVKKVRDYPFDSDDDANREIMKYDDRRELTIQIYQLNDDQQKRVIDIISQRESISFNPEEIEIDFETLQPITLHELAAYVQHVSKRRPRKPYTPKSESDAQKRKQMLVERIKKLGGVVPVDEETPKAPPKKEVPAAKKDSSSESSSSSSSSDSSDSSDSESGEKAEKRASEWTSSAKKAAPPRPQPASQPAPATAATPAQLPSVKVEKKEEIPRVAPPPPKAASQPVPKKEEASIPTEAPPSTSYVLPGARPLLTSNRPTVGAGISNSILDQLLPSMTNAAATNATNGDGTIKLSQDEAKASFNMFRNAAMQKEERKRQLKEEEERRRKAREAQAKEAEAQRVASEKKTADDAKRAEEERKARMDALRKAEQEKRKREILKNDVDMTSQIEMMANFEANF